MSATYYNEWEPYPAQWLRNLIAAGHLPPGDVDERSIADVKADDLKAYTQCHFFAGIGGWPHALRLAGWPGDRPVWTGSCPCQPLSSAGQRQGHADERHLWPAFHALIAERRPATIFGEQVASDLGREWLAGVRADLEELGHAVGAADLPAAGVGAPHIRQRLFWVADADGRIASDGSLQRGGEHEQQPQDSRIADGMADSSERRRGPRRPGKTSGRQSPRTTTERLCTSGSMGNTKGARFHRTGAIASAETGGRATGQSGLPGAPTGFWDLFDLTSCADGKARRVGAGIQPLAYGISARVGKLRAAGNAIVPQVAAAFVRAAMECRP